MAQYRDYQSPTVGQAGCTYSSLASTYSGKMASGGAYAPMANYVVPKMCPSGPGPQYPPAYNTFSHGQAYNCGGYFNIKGAYPYATCSSCQLSFTERPCQGNIRGQCSGGVEGYMAGGY